MQKIIVTGAAGFIGSKVAEKLLAEKWEVIGIDNINDYYDVRLKNWRLNGLKKNKLFKFYPLDIENRSDLRKLFQEQKIEAVLNLAARAGVRYSLENPFVYLSTNAGGNLNLLELCREFKIEKYILASTSSLYAGQKMPFKEELSVNTPISPYAATKKAAEVMAYTYHYLYGIDISVLRYFTVYGPAGRPDMSPFRFIKWVLEEKPIVIYGDGSQERDFTYIDDIAESTINAINLKNYEIINLGSGIPYSLMEMINLIEKFTSKKARLEFEEFQKADMKKTWADNHKAKRLLNWTPKIELEEGIKKTNWNWVKGIEV